jgi:hypothetical protein
MQPTACAVGHDQSPALDDVLDGHLLWDRLADVQGKGGNCDIKDLSRGSKVFFPVYVAMSRTSSALSLFLMKPPVHRDIRVPAVVHVLVLGGRIRKGDLAVQGSDKAGRL